jgi:hypothetical protein
MKTGVEPDGDPGESSPRSRRRSGESPAVAG